ncbi:MAG TPA: hypothetical protein VGK81_11115 [Anaerolineae bacterium]
MAAEKLWVVNEQHMVPLSEVQTVQPPERYYYVQRPPVAPVPMEAQPRVVYIQPAQYAPEPAPPVVIYQTTHDSGMIVSAFLALLIMLIVGFSAVLILAWVAAGRLPWLGY